MLGEPLPEDLQPIVQPAGAASPAADGDGGSMRRARQ
jgi:hypothetical protein